MPVLPLHREAGPVESAAPTGPAAFEVDALVTRYGGKRVLHGISCHVPERRVAAIMGPSGGGKTTLIKALNRTLELTPGAAIVSGQVRICRGGRLSPAPGPPRVRRQPRH